MYVKLATPPRALVVVGPASVTKLHILRLSHKPEIPEGLSCKAAAPSPSSSDGSFAMSTGPGTKFAAVTEPGSITKRSLDKAVDLTGRKYTTKAFDLEAPSFATLGSGRIICPPPSAPPHIPNSNYPRDYETQPSSHACNIACSPGSAPPLLFAYEQRRPSGERDG